MTDAALTRPRFLTPNWELPMSGETDDNHFDGANFLFADGHVKFRRRNSVLSNEFGLNSTAPATAYVPGPTLDPNQIS